jgi:hypothetical protein
VAGERELEAPAERQTLDGRHERLAQRLHLRLHVAGDRRLEYQARGHLIEVGTGVANMPPAPVSTMARTAAAGLGAPQPCQQGLAHREGQRVDRRVGDGQHRHPSAS